MRCTATACLLTTALFGCVPLGDVLIPAYLINRGEAPLKVSVIRTRPPPGSATRPECQATRELSSLSMGAIEDVENRNFGAFRQMPLAELDPESCQETVLLPPGKALFMYWDGSCSNYRKDSVHPYYAPTLASLRVEGADTSINLTGFETAEAFTWSSWRQDCRFVIH